MTSEQEQKLRQLIAEALAAAYTTPLNDEPPSERVHRGMREHFQGPDGWPASREVRDEATKAIAEQNLLADQYKHFLPFTGRLLHRQVPRGEWTEVPLP